MSAQRSGSPLSTYRRPQDCSRGIEGGVRFRHGGRCPNQRSPRTTEDSLCLDIRRFSSHRTRGTRNLVLARSPGISAPSKRYSPNERSGRRASPQTQADCLTPSRWLSSLIVAVYLCCGVVFLNFPFHFFELFVGQRLSNLRGVEALASAAEVYLAQSNDALSKGPSAGPFSSFPSAVKREP
jgi:hypothetical protein